MSDSNTAHASNGGDPFRDARVAAQELLNAIDAEVFDVGVVLGSGWGEVMDGLGDVEGTVSLSDVSGFVAPGVSGHRDVARAVRIDDRLVLFLGGRRHLYEGATAAEVVHGVRALAFAGCQAVILTNAAGSLRPEWAPGQLVVTRDHLNLSGASPMVGPEPPAFVAPRFCDLTDAYSPRLRAVARMVDPTLPEGVYAGLLGGNYETPAEISMLAGLGADLVGMSTVLETIAARHLGLEVLGLSLVTNLAAGLSPSRLDHMEVLAAGDAAVGKLRSVVGGVLQNLWFTN